MQFPTYYTHLDLILGRDFHRHRNIEPNDFNDVMALVVAIPYTNVVITEKFFAGVAHQHDLSDRFDTTIRTDLQTSPATSPTCDSSTIRAAESTHNLCSRCFDSCDRYNPCDQHPKRTICPDRRVAVEVEYEVRSGVNIND